MLRVGLVKEYIRQYQSGSSKGVFNRNQRTIGPVNAHLIFWPSKAQNIQNMEIFQI